MHSALLAAKRLQRQETRQWTGTVLTAPLVLLLLALLALELAVLRLRHQVQRLWSWLHALLRLAVRGQASGSVVVALRGAREGR